LNEVVDNNVCTIWFVVHNSVHQATHNLGICISTHVGDLFFMEWIIILKDFNANIPLGLRVRETFELNQLKPAPSQLLPVFFFRI
jgi:hypothetical protein